MSVEFWILAVGWVLGASVVLGSFVALLWLDR